MGAVGVMSGGLHLALEQLPKGDSMIPEQDAKVSMVALCSHRTPVSQTLNDRGLSVSKQFSVGTLVMTIAANIGDMAIIDFAASFPDSIVGFVPEEDVDLNFLLHVHCHEAAAHDDGSIENAAQSQH